MPAAHMNSDNILVALHQKSGETYVHSMGIRCLVSRHRQRAYKDKGARFRGSAKGIGRQLATAACIPTFACTSLH